MCRSDDEWHHIAVSWEFDTGEVRLFYDDSTPTPIAAAIDGTIQWASESDGGVPSAISQAAGRLANGSLVLGQVGDVSH